MMRPDDTRPVYLRLRDGIAAAIIEGRYREGSLLPSVRALAAEEGANPLTVAKACQQFQDAGLVVVRRGIGMEVVPGARARLLAEERARFLREEWPRVARRAQLLGFDAMDLLDAAMSEENPS